MTSHEARVARARHRLDVHFTSESSEWRTPRRLFDKLALEFAFTVDAAANDRNALCERYLTARDDARVALWGQSGDVAYCNPPYGTVLPAFIEAGEHAANGGLTVVMLIPARTDTRWWHSRVMHADEVRLIRGRIAFDTDEGEGRQSAPFPSCLVIWWPNPVYRGARPRLSSWDFPRREDAR